ncbi:hypothetical protein NGB36_04215 [Streptomyces sp. RB6PN25]|uniref:Transmembrane protein n=1 Tax=Streptomyces humicola TaxID=2953240 RepID=A0ABT1PQ56_9ACTN|nr:hypothetical protein [Streptomyces humicola]MCQ4079815.1 hypothetical protein [Streptomyces humicola]
MSLRTPHGRHRRPGRALGVLGTDRHTAHSPLERTSDRIQSWAGKILVVLILLALPAAVIGTDAYVYHLSMHTVRVQAATRRPATAQVLRNAPMVPSQTTVAAAARVTGAGRAPYVATASVTPGTVAGTILSVWVDKRTGAIVSAPLTASQASHDAGLAAAMVVPALPLAALGLWLALRRVLDRMRAARWDKEWEWIEPQWSGRYRDHS